MRHQEQARVTVQRWIGSLQIVGHVDATSGGQGLTGDITYQGTEYQATNDCAVTFTYGSGEADFVFENCSQ